MIRTKADSTLAALMFKPLCIALLLAGLFGLVWLRSSIVKSAYDIRTLEEKKMEAVDNMNSLLADRAKLVSLGNIDASFKTRSQGRKIYARNDYVFPDRIKVIHMKKNRIPEIYRASLDMRRQN